VSKAASTRTRPSTPSASACCRGAPWCSAAAPVRREAHDRRPARQTCLLVAGSLTVGPCGSRGRPAREGAGWGDPHARQALDGFPELRHAWPRASLPFRRPALYLVRRNANKTSEEASSAVNDGTARGQAGRGRTTTSSRSSGCSSPPPASASSCTCAAPPAAPCAQRVSVRRIMLTRCASCTPICVWSHRDQA
jgi:hypothetical protein